MMNRMIALVLASLISGAAVADTIDGNKRAVCTTETLRDCVAGADCLNGLPAEYGAPTSLRLDFSNKQVLSEKRKSKIRDFEKKDGQLLLQGRELGYGWTIAIEQKSGDMTLSLVNREDACCSAAAQRSEAFPQPTHPHSPKRHDEMKKLSLILPRTLLSAPLLVQAQNQPQAAVVVEKSPGGGAVTEAVQLQGKVKSVNKKARAVVVVGPNGNEILFNLSDEVRNFDQIKVGDLVTLTYAHALAL